MDRFKCDTCDRGPYNIIFSCDCERMIRCGVCVNTLPPVMCLECESYHTYKKTLQMVMMETTLVVCQGCDRQVRLSSMEQHILKKCVSPLKLVDPRILEMNERLKEDDLIFYSRLANNTT